MMTPLLYQLMQSTRSHRRRVWWQTCMTAGSSVLVVSVAVIICFIVYAQFAMVVHREWWLAGIAGGTLLGWCVRLWWIERQMPLVWQRLDRAYAWQHRTSTAAAFVMQHDTQPYASLQYADTMATIAATPATRVTIASVRIWALWGVWLVLAGASVLLATPFDAQIAAQTRTQQLAQQIAQQVAMLPPVDETLAATRVASQLVQQSDAQHLVAAIDVTMQQLADARTNAQRLAQYADALQRTSDPTRQADILADAITQLAPADATKLQSAYDQARAGDTDAYAHIQRDAASRQQAADAWQRTLAPAQQQAMQIAQAPAVLTQSQSGGRDGTQSEVSAPAPSDDRTSADTAQSGQGAQSGEQATAGQNGYGNAQTSTDAQSLQLFVPQIAADTTITLQSSAAPASGETVLTPGGGISAPSSQYRYSDIVASASQQAAQAIADAQIPWAAQQTVRDYFAVLQEHTP